MPLLNHIKTKLIDRIFIIICNLIIVVSIIFDGEAQNLCPNNSFETAVPCPSALSLISYAAPWRDPPGSGATSDLFNACHVNSNPVLCQDVGVPQNFSGSAIANTGQGYAGIIAYYGSALREYIQAPLISPMIAGSAYRVEAYFRRSSLCQFAVDNLGVLITSGAINQPGNANIPAIPQFEIAAVLSNDGSWTLLSGIYVASGGEDHITIGNFRDNTNTTVVNMGPPASSCSINLSSAYYYVDDVSVEKLLESVVIVGDTLICLGDSTTLIASANVNTWWSTAAFPADTLSTNDSIVVAPLVNTTYILNGQLTYDNAVVHVVSPPLLNLGNDTIICDGYSILLDATNPGASYLWSNGASDSIISADENQLYWVVVDNGVCTDTDSLNLTVLPNPPVDLGLDSVFCSTNSEFLHLDAGNGIAFSWSPGGDTTQVISVSNAITYTVTVTHLNSCTISSSITTIELCPVTVFTPKAFTPNDDGRNELFLPVLRNTLFYELRIFNRGGSLLFATTNPDQGWDGSFKGSKVSSGNYAFQITYGSITDSQRIDKKTIRGSVLLIR